MTIFNVVVLAISIVLFILNCILIWLWKGLQNNTEASLRNWHREMDEYSLVTTTEERHPDGSFKKVTVENKPIKFHL